MRYTLEQLKEAQSGFDAGNIVFDTFILEFEDEQEFVEHFNSLFGESYKEDVVETYSLYQFEDNSHDIAFYYKKLDSIMVEDKTYTYVREIYGVEG